MRLHLYYSLKANNSGFTNGWGELGRKRNSAHFRIYIWEDGGFWILKQATLPSASDKRSGQKAAEYAFQRTCRVYFESGRNLKYSS